MTWLVTLSLVPWGLAAQVAPTSQVWSLDEAVRRAVDQAYAVRVAETNVTRAQAQVDQARGALGPQVVLSGNGQAFDRKVGGHQTSGSISLGANLNLDLAGSVRGAIRAGNLNVDAQRDLQRSEIVQVQANVRTAYFGILQADALVAVNREALNAAQQRLRLGQARFTSGVAPRFDVIRLEGEVSQAEAALIESQNLARTARNALNNLLVLPIETPVQVEPVPIEDDAPATADEYAALAQRVRPELVAAERRVLALAEATRIENRGLAPTFGVGVSATHNARGSIFSPRNQGVASVQASLPIWDSGITRARTKAARQDEEAARLQAAELRLAVSLQVRQAMIRLENARAQRTVSRSQVATATEALRIATLRYEQGEGILLDVTTAQATLTAARAAQVNADYELLTALAELRRAIGTDAINPLPAAPLTPAQPQGASR